MSDFIYSNQYIDDTLFDENSKMFSFNENQINPTDEYHNGNILDDFTIANEKKLKDSDKRKGNAKAVNVLDMEGNLLGTYSSGLLAAEAYGVMQSDVSLCCRGLKPHVNGYRFAFENHVHLENAEYLQSLRTKRGYILEPVIEKTINNNVVIEDMYSGGKLNKRLTRSRAGFEDLGDDEKGMFSTAGYKVSIYCLLICRLDFFPLF